MRAIAAKYLLEARTVLRNSPIYAYYRPLAARRQRANVEELIRKAVTVAGGRNVRLAMVEDLQGRRSQRKPLPPTLREAKILGVGALGWERHGLWPSFERVCDFRLFNDQLGVDAPFICLSRAEQEGRCKRILEAVDARHSTHVCFVYADPSNLNPELFKGLHDRGIWTVLMGLDDRHTFSAYQREDLTMGVETIAHYVDLYWTSWRAGILLHHAIGSRAWLGGAAADPAFHRPIKTREGVDVLFLGQAYGARREIVEKLRGLGIRVAARGYGWGEQSLSFEECVNLFSSSRVVLGISAVGAMEDVTIMKGRDFEVPMCGACYVTQYSEELAEFFTIGQDLLCYSTPLQAAEIIATLLNDPERIERIRANALKQSLRRNTWEKRLSEMYDVLLDPSRL